MRIYFFLLIVSASYSSIAQESSANTAVSEYTLLPITVKHNEVFIDVIPATLNEQEIELIDKMFEDVAKAYNAEQRKQFNSLTEKQKTTHELLLLKPKQLNRQYIAMHNAKNEKVVWINAFCNAGEVDWKKDLVDRVPDGERGCHYKFKMNLTTLEYFDFRFIK